MLCSTYKMFVSLTCERLHHFLSSSHASFRCIPIASDRSRTGSVFSRIATPLLFARLGKRSRCARCRFASCFSSFRLPLLELAALSDHLYDQTLSFCFSFSHHPSAPPPIVTRGSASCCLPACSKHSFKAPAHFHPRFLTQFIHVISQNRPT